MRTFVGLLVLIALAGAYASFGGAGSGYANLPLRVQMAGDTLALTNTGTADASECSLNANSRFRRENVTLPKNEPVAIPLSSLLNNGTRFAPGTDELDRLHVICNQPRMADALFKPKG